MKLNKDEKNLNEEEKVVEKKENTEQKSTKSKKCNKKDKEKNEEIDKLKAELETQKDRFLRTAAEYENFRKRTEREKTAIYADATAFTLENILPVVDSVELAMKSSENASDEYKKGLELMANQIKTSFEKLGVTESGNVGDKFDPNFHNAVSHVDDENKEENVIVEVFQKGYLLKDKVIRHAMVKVAN